MTAITACSPLLDTAQAAKRLGLSASTLAKLRLTGEGPAYVKMGAAVRYLPQDVDDYAMARRRISTSANADAA